MLNALGELSVLVGPVPASFSQKKEKSPVHCPGIASPGTQGCSGEVYLFAGRLLLPPAHAGAPGALSGMCSLLKK